MLDLNIQASKIAYLRQNKSNQRDSSVKGTRHQTHALLRHPHVRYDVLLLIYVRLDLARDELVHVGRRAFGHVRTGLGVDELRYEL